jgi:glycosyltransferase involved in cell wall biosynthesis
MNVLYLHQHFSTPQGSAGIRSYAMAQQLIAQGHNVTIVCGSYRGGHTGLSQPFHKGQRRGTVDGIQIIEYNLAYANADSFLQRSRTFLRYAWRSIGIALTAQYDVLISTSTPLTVGLPGILARWLRRKPFVFEVRDLWPELPRAMGVIRNPIILQLMSALEWLSYRSAQRLIGLSPGIVKGIAARTPPKTPIAMIPNGCDLGLFNPASARPWRPADILDDHLLAIYSGTHGLANGLDAVLDAATELQRRQRHDIKILLIGQGQCKPALQARAQQAGLHNIIFHDPVDKQRLAGLFASADIGLQILANIPAFYDGTSPNKYFDYLAAGLPVLNNYPGWLAEHIHQHQHGYAIAPSDPQAFADALEHAADHRDQLKTYAANSQALAHKQYDRNQLAHQWVDWLEQATTC